MLRTLFILLLRYAGGATSPGRFVEPSTNLRSSPVYTEGSDMQIKWETSMSQSFLFLAPLDDSYIGVADILLGYIDPATNNESTWDWTATTKVNVDQNMFIFTMMDGANATNQFSSHIFNITGRSTSSSTASNPSSGPGLSPQGKVGVGVGVGVGCAFFIALAAAIWYRRRARDNSKTAAQSHGASASQLPAPASVIVDKENSVHPEARVEMPGGQRVVELPAQAARYELPL